MKVICKKHTTCEYSKTCPHSKLHEVITGNMDSSYNCTLLCDKQVYVIMPDSCFCDVLYTRKIKLEKLNNESNL